MENVEVISVDMFQTLVDLTSRCDRLWERILDHKIPGHLAGEYWSRTSKLIFSNYEELFRQGREYISSRAIMEYAFGQLAGQTGLSFQPE